MSNADLQLSNIKIEHSPSSVAICKLIDTWEVLFLWNQPYENQIVKDSVSYISLEKYEVAAYQLFLEILGKKTDL